MAGPKLDLPEIRPSVEIWAMFCFDGAGVGEEAKFLGPGPIRKIWPGPTDAC